MLLKAEKLQNNNKVEKIIDELGKIINSIYEKLHILRSISDISGRIIK